MNALLLAAALAPAADAPDDWKAAEGAYLKNIKQVTFDFVRAGEGYFSPDGTKAIFQAEEKDTGNPFYQIFVLDLKTGKAVRISPGVGRTTCGYFHPNGQKVIFASSHATRTRRSTRRPSCSSGRRTARRGPRGGGTRGTSTRT
jgi:Tol biopolymer transport system component